MCQFVLILDDDTSISEILFEWLRQENKRVVSVANGAEALSWLRQAEQLPDLILMDIKMPVMDGFRFHEEKLRAGEDIASIPVLVLTAGKADLHGADIVGTLRKPFDLEELMKRVNSLSSRLPSSQQRAQLP